MNAVKGKYCVLMSRRKEVQKVRVRKEIDGQVSFFQVERDAQTVAIQKLIARNQRNKNEKYKRDKRRRNLRCTVCGEKLTDTSYMICHVCRKKAADYMRESRQRKKDI